MRVLVTGGGGFVGSHLVERLEADGHEVLAARRRDFDLTSMEDTARLFADARPELVFHLAAEVGGIGANRANPGRYWYANLVMGAHVLEQSRLHEVGKLVVAGTVCAYPKQTPVPFREDALWDGYPEETNAPYGVAKKAVLVGGQAYREQYGLNTIYLLPANLYGPRDNFDLGSSHVIPALIRKMVDATDEVVLWGDGTPSREFLYVDDCVEGLLLAAEHYDGAEPVNLGTGIETTIRELAETIADVTGFAGEIVWDTSMPNGQTLNLLQSVVDWGLELEKFDTAGTSEEYGNVREAVAHHHDFDDAGALILHERSPINPKSIYATAKVAADFLTMNYHDAFGVPGVVTRMFNNYGPRQNPRYVTGTIITQALSRPTIELGALEPLRDFCFCTDGVRGHLTVAAHGIPGDVYVYGQGENISMADWAELIIKTGVEHGYWPDDREIVTTPSRLRPGATDVMALRVGYEKLHAETGWKPLVSWEEGVLRTIAWYADHRDSWHGRVDWLTKESAPTTS